MEWGLSQTKHEIISERLRIRQHCDGDIAQLQSLPDHRAMRKVGKQQWTFNPTSSCPGKKKNTI